MVIGEEEIKRALLRSSENLTYYTPCHPLSGSLLLALETLVRAKLGQEEMADRYPHVGSGIPYSNAKFCMKNHTGTIEQDKPHFSYFLEDGTTINFIWNYVFSGYVASNAVLSTEDVIHIFLDCMNSVVEYEANRY